MVVLECMDACLCVGLEVWAMIILLAQAGGNERGQKTKGSRVTDIAGRQPHKRSSKWSIRKLKQ